MEKSRLAAFRGEANCNNYAIRQRPVVGIRDRTSSQWKTREIYFRVLWKELYRRAKKTFTPIRLCFFLVYTDEGKDYA